MRVFGLVGALLSLAIVGYLAMARMNTSPGKQAAKIDALQKEHGIELPAGMGGDLTKLPEALKKDLEKKMKERTPD